MAKKRRVEEVRIPPVPEDATAAQLWEKLHHERKMWKDLLKRKQLAFDRGIREIQKVSNMVLARAAIDYGDKVSDTEYKLKIDQPKGLWGVGAVKQDDGKYELTAKKLDV